MPGENAYTALMGMGGGGMGQVEIVGDVAAMVTEADKGIVNYTQEGYKLADKTYVGLGNGQALGIGAQAVLRQAVVTPFKPLKLIIPSYIAPGLVVVGCQIGPTQMIDGQPICADAFTEVSNALQFSWPTVEMSQEIIITVLNRGLAAIQFLDIAFYGIRLRK
jgi:hypothetical protein